MAQVANPRKQFNWSISSPGVNAFLCQKVTIPDFEIDVVEHGDYNFDVKTGGRHKYGSLMIEKIATAVTSDTYIWTWMQEIQDVFIGGGVLPTLYKRTMQIDQFDLSGILVLNSWVCYGCWPSKINGVEFNRLGSENTLESIEIQVDQVEHL